MHGQLLARLNDTCVKVENIGSTGTGDFCGSFEGFSGEKQEIVLEVERWGCVADVMMNRVRDFKDKGVAKCAMKHMGDYVELSFADEMTSVQRSGGVFQFRKVNTDYFDEMEWLGFMCEGFKLYS